MSKTEVSIVVVRNSAIVRAVRRGSNRSPLTLRDWELRQSMKRTLSVVVPALKGMRELIERITTKANNPQ